MYLVQLAFIAHDSDNDQPEVILIYMVLCELDVGLG